MTTHAQPTKKNSDASLSDIFENFQIKFQSMLNKYTGMNGTAIHKALCELENGKLPFNEAKKIHDGLMDSKLELDALFNEVMYSIIAKIES